MNTGVRVIRGPGWKWGDQDNGEGGLGTMVGLSMQTTNTNEFKAVVQWDHNNNSNATYSYSLTKEQGELRLYDNSPCGVVNGAITCDCCNEKSLSGIRWKCIQCDDYDLCTLCYMKDIHMEEGHDFMRTIIKGTVFERVPNRKDSRKVFLKGVIPGSKVERGIDWDKEYKDQDGGQGSRGTVQSIVSYTSPVNKNKPRSFASVLWENGDTNTYRMGFRGNVDLLSVGQPDEPSQTVYIDHLPVLGGPVYFSSWEYTLSDGAGIGKGAEVVISRCFPRFKGMQEKEKLWKDGQEILIGRVLTLSEVHDEYVCITYDGIDYKIGKNIVQKIDTFRSGQSVRSVPDPKLAERLQHGHGGMNEKMKKKLGSEQKIVCIDQDGDVLCMSDGEKTLWNRLALRQHKTQKNDKAEELLAAAFLQALLSDRN